MGNTCYESTWTVFKEFKPPSTPIRLLSSFTTRTKAIVKERVKFASCHYSAVSSNPNVVDEDTTINPATGYYNGVNMSWATKFRDKLF